MLWIPGQAIPHPVDSTCITLARGLAADQVAWDCSAAPRKRANTLLTGLLTVVLLTDSLRTGVRTKLCAPSLRMIADKATVCLDLTECRPAG